MRFNSAPINGAAFNADVPGGEPAAPENGGGASFPFSRPVRGTALFATPQRLAQAEPPVMPVAMAARLAAQPEPMHARKEWASGSALLQHLADMRSTPDDQAQAVDAALARLRVDILLVDMGALLLRLELDALARMQAEEDEAIAMLMLLCD
jgi:hypothetical protein